MRRHQFELIQLIRNYFTEQGFLDVLTPPAVENPGMEVHIHPFQLHSVNQRKLKSSYLHTSPEFCLKELLADPNEGLERIFSISYCFLDSLYRWYAILSTDLATEYAALLKTPLRSDDNVNYHYEWAKSMPVQHIKSEFIIKLHSVMNGLQLLQ